MKTATPTATPIRPSKTSQARRPRANGNAERSGDRRDARDEREGAEERDQRGQADVRPDEDDDGEGDRKRAAQTPWSSRCGRAPARPPAAAFPRFMSVLLQLSFVDSSSAFCSSSSRAAVDPFALLLPGVAGAVARVRKVLVDGDAARADLGDRRLGLRSRLHAFVATLVCSRSRYVSQLSSSASTAATNVGQSPETSAVSECSATSTLVLSCPSFSSTSPGAWRAAARTDASSSLECVEMTPNPRQTAGLRAHLHAVDAAADLGELVLDGDGGGAQIEPPVRVVWQHEGSGPPMPTLCQPRRRFCQLR